ncbi:ferredoxin [Streptosporangium pseudovulgare]|uniref:Ferredoxin n=1 Tax=Streptosporangium pseudovulgare TaxID=35765 RepID=A0ABQ2RDR4_9ACTN|nr:ferredoxin [Streptosporangium pseudovulgare]GGQ26861.1 ferredoxin [Streptosporangium pseudovulgare]
MKVTVDQDACTGSGQCVLIAPDTFDQRDEDGIVTLLHDSPQPGLREDVREAARICPALAIRLTIS